jgi:hypothetical protein
MSISAKRSLNKKSYYEFKAYLEEELGNKLSSKICSQFCDIFKYDPDLNTYTEQNKRLHDNWRKKKAEEFGVTLSRINKGIKTLTIDEATTT